MVPKKGLDGASEFLYKQSEEERAHMLKLFAYINETGGQALAPEVKKSPDSYKSVVEVFKLALKQEQQNTKSINSLVELCWSEKDYSTFNFLQWYVAEQHEEEMVFKSILDKVDLIGTDGDYTLHWKILGVVDSLEAGREWVIIDREHTEGTTTIGGSATSKAKIYGYDDYGDTWNDIVGTWSEPTEGRAPIWGETLDFSLNANEFFTLEIPQSSNWTAET